jgi:5-aminolevulinate synthase
MRRVRTALNRSNLPVDMRSTRHIIPFHIGDAARSKRISRPLIQDFGIYLQPINYPSVPVGTERFRITPTPLHTPPMIEHLCESLRSALESC